MFTFQTKRQQRQKKLQRWTDKDWSNLPHFLTPWTGHVFAPGDSDANHAQQEQEIAAIITEWTSDPDKRSKYTKEWLDKAEDDAEFGKQLDRYLGLLTDDEETEKKSHDGRQWKAMGFLLALIGLIVAILAFIYK